MNDAIGRPVMVGDIVFFGNTSRYATFGIGYVLRDTRKTIVVLPITASRKEDVGRETRLRMPEHLLLINSDTHDEVLAEIIRRTDD